MRVSPPMVGALMVLSAVVMWGAQFPVAKSAMQAVDVLQSSVLRYALPTAVMCALLAIREGRRGFAYEGRGAAAWTIGVIGMACSPLLVFGGLSLSRPETVAIIVSAQPTMTVLAEWRLRGRRPRPFTLVCVALAFIGVVTVVTRWSVALLPTGAELFGDLLALAGAACWVAYTMTIERFAGWSSLKLTTLTMIAGTVGTVAACAVGLSLGVITPVAPAVWWSVGWQLAYLALIGVLAAMLCWNNGVRRIGTINAVLFVNLTPVVTFAVRYLQGQVFEPIELAGAALVIAALLANNLYQRFSRASA